MTQYTPGVTVKSSKGAGASKKVCCKRIIFVLIPVALIAALSAWFFAGVPAVVEPRMEVTPEQAAALASSVNGFTMDLYSMLSKQEGESANLFFSPLSVMTAMSMTLVGCKANTHQQLANVLKVSQDDKVVKAVFDKLISSYQTTKPGYEMRVANMMYASHLLEMQPEFASDIANHFHASAKTVNFGEQTEAVRTEINSAVEKETNSKIKDLIPTGVLNTLTRLVLVNAVYFKGLWEIPFDKNQTSKQPFYVSEDTAIQTQMMFANKKFRVMSDPDLGARILSMDYKDSNISMVIVLPNKRTGLSEVEEKLRGVNLNDVLADVMPIKVEVGLPRFRLEYSTDLVDSLTKMGSPDLFSEKADLSGIGGEPGELYVSKVLHKAFLEVNEEGSEAAAATAMIAMTRMMLRPEEPFVADRPFLFLIHDRDTNTILFAGRYAKPEGTPAKIEL